MKGLIYTIILSTISIVLIGCKARTVFVPVESVKTEYRDRLERDSIYLKDYVRIYQKGDTVFKDSIVYKYKEKLVRDTICKTDSIAVPYPVVETKEVNKLKSWQIILMILGGFCIGYFGFRVVRLFK